MTQYMRPSSDINSSWICSSGIDRYALIDEVTPDDNDGIYSIAYSYQECGLSAPSDTPAPGECTLRFRVDTGSATVTPSIRCGATVIKTGSEISSSNAGFVEYMLTLSAAEMANVTDWNIVRVCFAAVGMVFVSWAVFEVPDKVAESVGSEMGCSF